ncbi:hypothetical protein ACFW9L_19885, partial [Streptomyces sp. NPDC059517]|uniref:hypothetical protein n=1 Tax=Streptomyces sp. NPDC059517 TaxID=3346855 RepID=UPI0036A36B48
EQYPDAQLHLDLRGYTPGEEPLAPPAAAEALQGRSPAFEGRGELRGQPPPARSRREVLTGLGGN